MTATVSTAAAVDLARIVDRVAATAGTPRVPAQLGPAPAESMAWVPSPGTWLAATAVLSVAAAIAWLVDDARNRGLHRWLAGLAFLVGWGGFVLTFELALGLAPLALSWLWIAAWVVRDEGLDGDAGTIEEGDQALDEAAVGTDPPGHDFDDVAGMADLKETLRDRVIEPLADPERYEEYGLGAVNGVLFYGPPGCGKTFLAGAVAGETDYSYVEVTPTDITSKYIGQAADNVAELFAIARDNEPCLLFIDEIDAIAGERSGEMTTSEQQMVNQLLTELESVEDHDVVVFAATNYLEEVDEAILRSGRFDERIEIPPPDRAARREILELALAEPPTASYRNYDAIARAIGGYASSDVELVAEVATRHALADGDSVGQDHLWQAVEETESSIPGWLDRYDLHDATDDRERVEGLDDVPGMDRVKQTVRERVLDPVRDPERYREAGVDPVDGALLYGPPGCGKTTLVEAVGAELDRPVVTLDPERIHADRPEEPGTGVAEAIDEARSRAPSVLVVDDVDAMAPADLGEAPAAVRRTAGALVDELPHLADDDVVVLGTATRVVDVHVDALHSGSFDERLEVPAPDADTRIAALRSALPDDLVGAAPDWQAVAAATEGYAIRDLEAVAQEAAREALRADEPVDTDHLLAAADRTGSGVEAWGGGSRYYGGESDLRYIS